MSETSELNEPVAELEETTAESPPPPPLSDIQKAINKLPKLTDTGLGLAEESDHLSSTEYKEAIKQAQQQLLEKSDEFDKVCKWLEQIDKSKSINHKHSSFGLKTLAEKDCGAILHGTFIAAAIHCGFKFKTRNRSQNVKFNMSEESITALSAL